MSLSRLRENERYVACTDESELLQIHLPMTERRKNQKMKKFWNWKNQTETAEWTLFLNGTIAEESWFDDDVTPQLFKDELRAKLNTIKNYI